MATSSPPNPPRAAMLTPAARWHDACFSAMQPPTVGGERRRGLLCGQVGEHVSRGGEADGVTAERGLVGEVAQDHGLADAVGAEQHGVSSTMRMEGPSRSIAPPSRPPDPAPQSMATP